MIRSCPRWCAITLVLSLPLAAAAQSTVKDVLEGDAAREKECQTFLRHRSSCAKDSHCTALSAGCGDHHAVSKADAPRFMKAASSCSARDHCSMTSSPPSIPVCEASRCVLRMASAVWENPLNLCLERHLERFPGDTARLSVKVSPREGGGISAVSDDPREVARCLEDVLVRSGSTKVTATLEFVPGTPLPDSRPRVVGSPYQRLGGGGLRSEAVVLDRDAGND